MTIAFIKPENHRDWISATQSVAKIIINAISVVDPITGTKAAISGYSSAQKLSEALKGQDTTTPENKAWKWLSLTLAEAVALFLRELRKDEELQRKNLDNAVKEFLEKGLEVPGHVFFDEAVIRMPSAHSAIEPARNAIPQLVLDVSTKADFDSAALQRFFDKCVSEASLKVFAACHDDLAPIFEAVAGPAGEAIRREAAWARHFRWIEKRYTEEPVFSPDPDTIKTPPLSELYLRLRCYWHTELSQQSQDDAEETKKHYQAHLADLHGTIETWLDSPSSQRVRVVAGGPGSGKSSFAKAFAYEVATKSKYRVLFVELQRIALTNDMYQALGVYWHRRNKFSGVHGSPGFAENPLDWIKDENRPTVIIFDGLDEITQDNQAAKDLAKKLILNVQRLTESLTTDGTNVRAVILGRNASCQDGLEAASLPLETMLNVAPIRGIEKRDLRFAKGTHSSDIVEHEPELSDQQTRDQRPDYWRRWAKSQGKANEPMPEAVTHASLRDLNVEPLLLHLLILSDYCGNKWPEAADNRNLVYEDILSKIHGRNNSERKHGQHLKEDEFFLLMECMGLAAWHGNTRSGDENAYTKTRDIHARKLKNRESYKYSGLDSMVLQTHAKKVEGVKGGFEFIHKTFSEYLIARALVTLTKRSVDRMSNREDPIGKEVIAREWVDLIGTCEMTFEIHQFLKGEFRCRIRENPRFLDKEELENLLYWSVENGMPVMNAGYSTYRQHETAQRCAETALLMSATSWMSAMRRVYGMKETLFIFYNKETVSIDWESRPEVALLHRIKATSGNLAIYSLSHLDFSLADLQGVALSGADLSGADLSEAVLSGADLSDADLSEAILNGAGLIDANLFDAALFDADLRRADLRRADLRGTYLNGADLSGADLSGADLSGAKLDAVDLQSTNLTKCKFGGVSARSVDFAKAFNFSPEEVHSIFGVRSGFGLTTLPEGVDYPDFWHEAEQAENESLELVEAYQDALRTWRRGLT